MRSSRGSSPATVAAIRIQLLVDFDVVEVGVDGLSNRDGGFFFACPRRDGAASLHSPAFEFENFAAAGFENFGGRGPRSRTAALAVFIPLQVVGAGLASVPDEFTARSFAHQPELPAVLAAGVEKPG